MTATEETVDDRVVIRDVFPATVTDASGQVYRSASVIITRDRVLVYVTRAAPVLDAPYDPGRSVVPRYNAPRGHRSILVVDGRNLVVERQRGCACSSPLKGWRPWRPYRTAA